MKNIRKTLIVMGILVIAAIAIFFTANHFSNKNKQKAVEEANELVIFDFDSSAATQLEIHNESGEYLMEYDKTGIWKMVSKHNFEANSNTATNICSALSELTAVKIIEDEDISKYGFDNPITLSITANDKVHTLKVGSVTPTNEYFYVMKDGSKKIYLIDYTTGLILSATKDALKSMYIADFLSNEVEHFAIWDGKESDENVRFSMNKSEDGTWYMEKPYQDDSIYNSDISTFINDAIRDKIYNFIQEDCQPSDYEKYGFDDPQYVYEISSADKYIKVIFGDMTNNDTEMYGLFTETGQVVTFYKNTVAVLGYQTSDMMNKSVYSPSIDYVTDVKITMPDKEAVLKINEEKVEYNFNGTDIDVSIEKEQSTFIDFFGSFNNAYFETVDRKAKPSGDAEVTIEYKLSDGTETTIEYIPVPGEDSNTYWAMKNGEYTGFIVRKKVIANISTCYDAVVEALK